MKNHNTLRYVYYLSFVLICSACHAEKAQNMQADNIAMNAKTRFKSQFTDECLARESADSLNPEETRERFQKSCSCVADRMAEGLTEKQAAKYLDQKKNTQSMRIRFDNAAYKCLQGKKQPKTVNLFAR